MKSGLREPCCTETAWTNFYLCVHEVTGCSSRGASPGARLWLCQLHTAHQFFWAGLVVTPQVRAGLEILSKHEVWAKCLGFGKHRWVFLWHTPRRLTAVNTHLFPITTGTREFWALPRQLRLDSWMEKLNWTTSLKGTYLEANNPRLPTGMLAPWLNSFWRQTGTLPHKGQLLPLHHVSRHHFRTMITPKVR